MTGSSTPRLPVGYRPDIDGLRAIAVLAVVAFHAFPAAVPGGFVGVDIFFVISGFLISSIIFAALDAGTFTLSDFYVRRIRRIFPALIVVMLASAALGWYVLLESELRQLGKHLSGSAGFLQNFVLWRESGYFDKEAETKPLLHLWSLATEEQFYVFWPLLLLFLRKRRWGFLRPSLAIGAVSFALCAYLSVDSPLAAFYSPVSRSWELMIGCTLAQLSLRKPDLGGRYRDVASGGGLALLALALASTDKARTFPGWWALPPTLGAFLIIAAGPRAWVNRYLLSNRLMVSVGLLSYPLYLWHWPLLSFARIVGNQARPLWLTLLAVGAAVALARATYVFIERPIRFGATRHRWVVLLSGAMGTLLALGLTETMGRVGARLSGPELDQVLSAIGDWEYPRNLEVDASADGVYFLNGASKHTTLLLGDSHVQQYSPRVVAALREHLGRANKVIFATSGGCPPIPEVFEDSPVHRDCSRQRTQGFDLIRNADVKSVVIGACWDCYFINEKVYPKVKDDDFDYYVVREGRKASFRNGDGAALALANLEDFIRSLGKDKQLYLLLDNPSGRAFDPQTYVVGHRWSLMEVKKLPDAIGVDARHVLLRQQMVAMAARLGIQVLDPQDMLCPGGACAVSTRAGVPIYRDNNHIRPFFVRENAAFLDKALLTL